MCDHAKACGKKCSKLRLDDPSLDTAMRELPCGGKAEHLLEGRTPKADATDHRARFNAAVFDGSAAQVRRG